MNEHQCTICGKDIPFQPNKIRFRHESWFLFMRGRPHEKTRDLVVCKDCYKMVDSFILKMIISNNKTKLRRRKNGK